MGSSCESAGDRLNNHGSVPGIPGVGGGLGDMTGVPIANGLLGKEIGGPVFAVTGCWDSEAGGKTLFGCGVAVGIRGLNGGFA